MATLSWGKCCPHWLPIIGWTSESWKVPYLWLYGQYCRTVQLRFAMWSVLFKLVWDLAILCYKWNLAFSSGLNFVSIVFQDWAEGLSEFWTHHAFYILKDCSSLCPLIDTSFNFFPDGIFICHHPMNWWFDSGLSVTLRLIVRMMQSKKLSPSVT